MSWFGTSDPQNDAEIGREAVRIFHNRSVYYSGYVETLDSLLSKIAGGKSPEYFLDGLGLAIRSIGMSDGQVDDAMVALADTFQGKIPKPELFNKALSDRVSNPTAGDYLGATPQIALETAGTAIKGLQEVGDSVLAIGSTLTQIGPILIVAAIIFIGYSRTRQIAGR